jgi:UDP-N-acetylglucosamine--N-acetylmuramyl-(pentapeptide) pyrophosphoryl-undecaprenol N-acetylglucosamine transferase
MSATRDAAINHFGLDPARKVLLVFGGSRGARAINIAVGDILGDLLADGIQVIHVTGTLDWERSQAQAGVLSDHEDYHAYAYLHDDMGLAFAAADLAVCRAGASILGEFPYFALPSILVPLAYSWRYQQVNADYLAERGAALHMNEADIDTELLPALRSLLNDEARLNAMAEAAATLAMGNGAEKLAALLAQLAQERS